MAKENKQRKFSKIQEDFPFFVNDRRQTAWLHSGRILPIYQPICLYFFCFGNSLGLAHFEDIPTSFFLDSKMENGASRLLGTINNLRYADDTTLMVSSRTRRGT